MYVCSVGIVLGKRGCDKGGDDPEEPQMTDENLLDRLFAQARKAWACAVSSS